MVETEFLTLQDKRELVNRVVESDLFRRAPRQREFLLYVADCTLENRLDGVREQAVAEKVFHRSPDQYDVSDTIVRAEARNLRKRLEKYFETEGAGEPFIIVMPKGGYSLAFRARASEAQQVDDPETLPAESVIALPITPELTVEKPKVRSNRLLLTVALIASAICVVAVFAAIRFHAIATTMAASTEQPALPFSELFTNSRDTLIVTSDTAFLQIAQLARRRLTLDDYLTRSYPEIPHLSPPDLVQGLNRFEYTDAAETGIAGLIMRQNAAHIRRTYLRSGHQVQLADFKNANIVLLGSPISNPWAELYANQLNFQFDLKQDVGIILSNRRPQPGELEGYPGPDDARLNRTYAHVVFMPHSAEQPGSVLLIAGTTAEATQAAGEFLLDQAKLSATLNEIGITPASRARYFELLLAATTFVGGTTESNVVAYRLHPFSAAK